jgi:sporulation protein YlmC with PRC-barrel domain
MASQVMTEQSPFQPKLEDWAAVIPAERFLRRERSLRFERNAAIYATDGRVGMLKKVIVDEKAGEVKGLIVKLEASDKAILVPVDLVEKTGGTAIFLNLRHEEFFAGAAYAPVYEKRRFKKANVRAVRKNGAQSAVEHRREAVTHLSVDIVETVTVTKFDLL